jgi:hypothetical protein
MKEELEADQIVAKPVKGTHPVDSVHNRVID